MSVPRVCWGGYSVCVVCGVGLDALTGYDPDSARASLESALVVVAEDVVTFRADWSCGVDMEDWLATSLT